MNIRNRVIEHRRVRLGDLKPHPLNWRTHPKEQADALRGMLAEVGFAGTPLTQLLPDGTLRLIDGHLRSETTPDLMVDVAVTDLNDEEAKKLLATFDPLGAMAEANTEHLDELLQGVATESAAVQAMLDALARDNGLKAPDDADDSNGLAIPEKYMVLVECEDEPHQAELLERFTAEGLTCRSLIS